MLLLFYKGSNSNSLQTLVVIYLDWVDINGHRSWNTFKYSSVTKMPSQDGLRRLHYSAAGILAWQIPRSEEPSALRPWDHKELDVTEWLRACVHAHTHTHTLNSACVSSFLPYPKSSFSSPASSPRWLSPICFLFFIRTEVISLQPRWLFCLFQQAEHPFLKE